MNTAINIALLLLGAAATLTAFGGETWQKGTEPLLRRITARGWLSLSCLLVTLILATYKEIRAQEAEEISRRDAETSNAQLAAANTSIAALYKELQTTTQQLAQQTQVNLITVLANGDPVREGAWWLELSQVANGAADIAEFLYSSIPPAYRPALLITVHFHPTLGLNSSIAYHYESGQLQVVPAPKWQKDTVRVIPPGFLDRESPFPRDVEAERLKTKHNFIMVATPPADAKNNAAIAFRDIAEGHEVGTLTLSLEKTFSSKEEWKSFVSSHADLKTAKAWHNNNYRVEFVLPQDLKKTVIDYWRATITKSDYHVYLDSKAHLMISAPAKLDKITDSESAISASFVPAGKPELRVGIEEFKF